MSKTHVKTGKLNIIERLKSSVNGNPRYSFVLVYSDGSLSDLIKTKPDSTFGYSITNYHDKFVSVVVGYHRNTLSLVDIIKD